LSLTVLKSTLSHLTMERSRSSAKDIIARLQRNDMLTEHKLRHIHEETMDGAIAWIPLTLQGTWVVENTATYGVPSFMRDSAGIVRLRGMVKSGSVPSTIANLPLQFRPAYTATFDTVAADAHARIDVEADGDVRMITGSNTWVSLWPIQFPAEQ
jgi:hypothetical protein